MGSDATNSGKPRKVIVGTCMFDMWGAFPGFDQRLDQLGSLIDDMDKKTKEKYGAAAHLDLVVLPEYAVTSGKSGPAKDRCVPLEGKVMDYFGAKARQHQTYIVAAMELSDDAAHGGCTNAAALFDRQGNLAGIYRKNHPVAAIGEKDFEGGMIPGTTTPAFDCDFGRVGIQICFDITYDDGWARLGEQGAELVAWPTQSPRTIQSGLRALANRFYIVSSTWRDNASVIDPSGTVIAQITKPEDRVLVDRIDLSYAILPWQSKLREGRLFAEQYGDRAGYRYSAREDTGVFWSNDPNKPIMAMLKEQGLYTEREQAEYNSQMREKILAEKGGE